METNQWRSKKKIESAAEASSRREQARMVPPGNGIKPERARKSLNEKLDTVALNSPKKDTPVNFYGEKSVVDEIFLEDEEMGLETSLGNGISHIYMEPSGISLPEIMDKLREFNIFYGSISEIQIGRNCSFLSLVKVHMFCCEGLRELTFLLFAPNLRNLEVSSTNQLEDIINKEKACEVENSRIVPFQKLNKLRLADLPELMNIYWSPLPFPCLKEICVKECPNLKKLPLDSQSGRDGENGLIITYTEKEWIRGVEWEDESTKTHFLTSSR